MPVVQRGTAPEFFMISSAAWTMGMFPNSLLIFCPAALSTAARSFFTGADADISDLPFGVLEPGASNLPVLAILLERFFGFWKGRRQEVLPRSEERRVGKECRSRW